MGVQLRVALGYQLGLVLKEMTELIDSACIHTIQYNDTIKSIMYPSGNLSTLVLMLVIIYDL